MISTRTFQKKKQGPKFTKDMIGNRTFLKKNKAGHNSQKI